ncbi:MAG: beta-galactosidase [Clostridia bacterium]|nr:beta-galactosidase [Clostridia bacterium]
MKTAKRSHTLRAIGMLLCIALLFTLPFAASAEDTETVTVAYKKADGSYCTVKEGASLTNATPVTVACPTLNRGISIKFIENDIAARFTATVSKETYATLRSIGQVEVGMLITPKAYVEKAGAFTMEALDALEGAGAKYVKVQAGSFYAMDGDDYVVAGSLASFSETTCKKNPAFAAAAYLSVTINGEKVTVYSPYEPEKAQDIKSFLETLDTSNLPDLQAQWVASAVARFHTESGANTEGKQFIYRIWNSILTPMDTFRTTVDAAYASGFTAIKIHIPWTRVEKTAGSYDFSDFDPMVEYVISKGMGVAISLDMTQLSADRTLIPTEHLQCDPTGKVGVGATTARTSISFSSAYATGKAEAFYRAAVTHFEANYSKNILLYLPAFTPYCESEYWCGGEYDYSVYAIDAFRAYLAELYESVEELNAAIGEDFASFDTVVPPSCTNADNFGILWQNFRHKQLKAFIDRLAAAQAEISPNAKFALQFGSVFDNEVPLRGTMRFAELCEHADVVWLDNAPDHNHAWSLDYLRTALPEGVAFATEIDSPTRVHATMELYREQAYATYERGGTYLSIANWQIDEYYESYEVLWREIKEVFLSGEPHKTVPVTENSPVLHISLLNYLKQGSLATYLAAYNTMSPNGEAVRVNIVDDIPKKVTPESLSYSFPSGFSATQGEGGFFYASHTGGTFTPMTWDSTNKRWQGTAPFTLISDGTMHPDAADAALIFRAPKAGEVTVSVSLLVADTRSDGVRASLIQATTNATLLEPTVIRAGDQTTFTVTCTLREGDEIALCIGKNGNANFDSTRVLLDIKYN